MQECGNAGMCYMLISIIYKGFGKANPRFIANFYLLF
jgi:hypothetical protein